MSKGLTYNIKKVTPVAMKVLMKNGMQIGTEGNITDLLLKIAVNENVRREICRVVFTDDFSKVNMDEIDLEEISKGIYRFLSAYLNPSLN
jgi:hypothetical protein